MTIPTLEGQRVQLVPVGLQCLEDMFEYSTMPEFYAHFEFPPQATRDETKRYLEKLLSRIDDGNAIYWGIQLKGVGKVIGTIGILNSDLEKRRCELGYGISPRYWNQGYFSEALQLVLQYCFGQLDFERIAAFTSADNLPSIKGLIRNGFKEEGCLRKFYRKFDGTRFDAILLAILREEYTKHFENNKSE